MKAFVIAGESKIIEYKREYSKTILKTISAFANYHDGRIIIGINDAHEVIGVTNPIELKLNIENAINDNLEPKPYFEIESLDYQGKILIVLSIFKGEYTPYTYQGKAYRRSDTSTIQVDRHAYEELILLGRNQSFDNMYTEYNSLEFSILSSKLKTALNIQSFSDDLLITLGLKVNGQYNNAATLLSDKNPMASASINLVAYHGDSVAEIKDHQLLKNRSLLEQFDSCMDFYKKHINTGEIIKGPYRETLEEVPLVAYREAVANLIVHRDYSRDVEGRIEVFSNRIEVTSPGGLPIGILEEEYLEGRISSPRNKVIADVFLRLKIIEKLATGIRRIKEYYKIYDIIPTFKVTENSITVILPKVRGFIKTQDEVDFDFLNLNQRKIYDLLKLNGRMKRWEIEQTLGLKKTQTIELINTLRAYQIIIQIGNGRNTQYQLK